MGSALTRVVSGSGWSVHLPMWRLVVAEPGQNVRRRWATGWLFALGNGDSGGPALVQVEDQWRLSGLASWKVIDGHMLTASYGRYDQVTCNVRLGHYADWIRGVISGQP